MDWDKAIERNRGDLLRLVAWMLAHLGIVAGQGVLAAPISRAVRLAVLRMLRLVEAATRRLIVIEARGLVVQPGPPRGFPEAGIAGDKGARAMPFALFDPRKRFDRQPKTKRAEPRVTIFDGTVTSDRREPADTKIAPDDAGALLRRIAAVGGALEDLPKQAVRLARRRAILARKSIIALSPMRPRSPPGYRMRRRCWKMDLLEDVDRLARRIENEAIGR